MKDSLKKLMSMFPWFFDKSKTSNFHKSQDVTNRRFQELANDLFKIYESFHLNKRLLVWREQTENHNYVINFVANFPYLKQVTIYKKNTSDIESVICSESFNYEDNASSFEYSYNHSTLDDNYPENIVIPPDSFRIKVETWDEHILEKGYPENDIFQGNVFDHDHSLDIIGESNDIPRKEYIDPDLISPDLYPATEPPWNNCGTEDDYHYMKRMIEYARRLHTTPAPVLEIWKLYGIEARMENRERLLLKVFDEDRHDGLDWAPMPWEHKDTFCNYSQIEGIYFMVQYSTNTPTRYQTIKLDFLLVNSYGDNIADDSYFFDIYVEGAILKMDLNQLYYHLQASLLPRDRISVIRVDCKDSSGKLVGTVEFNVKIIGCDDSTFFVSTTGSDNNDGLTRATAFKTLQKACNSLQTDNGLIGVLSGNYTITDKVAVPHSVLILGCGTVVIENTTDNCFFRLAPAKTLELQEIQLRYDEDTHVITQGIWINNNEEEYVNVITHDIEEYHYIITSPLIKNLSYSNGLITYETITIEELSDLDGVIYNLKFENHEITYKEFTYTSDGLTPTEIEQLRNAVTSLTFDEDKNIKYTVLGDEI